MKTDLQKIKEAMNARGTKKIFVADAAGISPSMLTLIFQKKRNMTQAQKEKMFKALEIKK